MYCREIVDTNAPLLQKRLTPMGIIDSFYSKKGIDSLSQHIRAAEYIQQFTLIHRPQLSSFSLFTIMEEFLIIITIIKYSLLMSYAILLSLLMEGDEHFVSSLVRCETRVVFVNRNRE